MVRLHASPDPRASRDFKIGDPACGTGGFLVAAYEWLKDADRWRASTRDTRQAASARHRPTTARELVARPRRLALMNLYLHQVEPHISLGDSIYETVSAERFDVVLTNPPFGTRGANQAPDRDDFVSLQLATKQLNFLQHVLTILKPGGRSRDRRSRQRSVRRLQAGEVFQVLMEDCDRPHRASRCPRGTFSPYTEGTKTNVIFFTKGRAD